MIEILAIVAADPMSWPVWAVLALAAGMYPLGFMFGVCSECCGEPCPDECDRCAGINHFDRNWPSACSDTFDLVTMESDVDSATKANVTPSGNRIVDLSINFLTGLDCRYAGTDDVFAADVFIESQFLEFPAGFGGDECGCPVCEYRKRLFFGLSGLGNDGTSFCEVAFNFQYDKCKQKSASTTVSLTKEQIELCLLNGNNVECDDIPETVEIVFTYDLDYECECGACCRDGICSENEAESYCEDDGFYSLEAQGTWQGVGTDCDPNPCT